MEEEEFMLMFPPDGLVYDYRLDDAGTSLTERVNEGWVVVREGPVRWVTWTHDLTPYEVSNYYTRIYRQFCLLSKFIIMRTSYDPNERIYIHYNLFSTNTDNTNK